MEKRLHGVLQSAKKCFYSVLFHFDADECKSKLLKMFVVFKTAVVADVQCEITSEECDVIL